MCIRDSSRGDDGQIVLNGVGLNRALNYINDYIVRNNAAAHAGEQAARTESNVKLTIPSNVSIAEDYNKDDPGENENIGDFPLPPGASISVGH